MNSVCPSCLTKNRLPEDRLNDDAKCGRCSRPLFDGEIVNADKDTIDTLLQDDLPIIIDFWAPWCGPCLSFAPIFEDVAQERATQLRFLKVDTEAEQELSARFRIRSIPTIMLFHKGQLVEMLNGAIPKESFNQWLDEALSKKA